MNLIPVNEVPALPNNVLIGWDEIKEHEVVGVPFFEKKIGDLESNNKRRKEHVSSRKLFSELLCEMEVDSSSVLLKKMDLGKPYALLGNTIIHTSFSHSPNWVVCALSSTLDIGIDCEPLEREVNPRILDRILASDEKKLLSEQTPLAIWTMKEAVVKCIGTGIRTSLQKYALLKEGERYYVNWEKERIYITPFIWNNHQLSLAWRA